MQKHKHDTERLGRLNEELVQAVRTASSDSDTLDSVACGLSRSLAAFKEANRTERLGLVSGIISSDGERAIGVNLKRLRNYSRVLRREYDFPMFSAADIFTKEFLLRYEPCSDSDWDRFWERILGGGNITDILMTPRWDKSAGARFELRIAKTQGMEVHMVHKNPKLMVILFGLPRDPDQGTYK